MIGEVLSADFYDRPVAQVAQDLLGRLLCRRSQTGLTVGRIVEAEAYMADGDSASHSYRGLNRKNASMYGPPGHAYIYTIHARQCVNVVTEPKGVASAVLIRAVEPVTGLPLMVRRRGTVNERDLCRGPARLCEAFDIGRRFDGWNLTTGRRLWIARGDHGREQGTGQSPRIGVTSAHDQMLRFFVLGSPFVSGTRAINSGN